MNIPERVFAGEEETKSGVQSYEELLEWLYATQMFGVKLGLEVPKRLVARMGGEPGPDCRVVHVAGTNGKGSTCVMIDALARAHGLRTGLFTSPHLVDFRERIRVNGEMAGHEELAEGMARLRELARGMESSPTFFELVLALAMWVFSRHSVDLVILETGLGGRMDATNCVAKDIAVLTPISRDHQEYLGDTLEAIAGEKAGIIAEGKPVISASQEGEAEAVIRRFARERRAQCVFCGRTGLKGYAIALPGAHQRQNAELACEALCRLGVELRSENVAYALANLEWPARFQIFARGKGGRGADWVVDGSHNPQGCGILKETWRQVYGDVKPRVIFGAVADKDVGGMLAQLAGLASEWHLVPVDSPRAMAVEKLEALLAGAAGEQGKVFRHESLGSAIGTLQGDEKARDEEVLICGSLYLAGEALSIFSGETRRSTAQ